MEQRTPEWMAARAGRFTSSRAADLMAKTRSGPSASRGNLLAMLAVERITGSCVETYTNAAMQRGTDLEAEARDAYSFSQGVAVDEVGIVLRDDMTMVSSSPDGMIGTDGLLEIKCPASMQKHLAALTNGEHATEYRWQLQHQMMTTGRTWVDAVSYDPRFPDGLQLAIKRVHRDDDAIAELRREIIAADDEVGTIVDKLQALRGAA